MNIGVVLTGGWLSVFISGTQYLKSSGIINTEGSLTGSKKEVIIYG